MDPDPGSMSKVQTTAKNINFAGAGAANKGSAPLHWKEFLILDAGPKPYAASYSY